MPICLISTCQGACGRRHLAYHIKSQKVCHRGSSCKFKSTCCFLHPGEQHLVGTVFWRRVEFAKPPAPSPAPVLQPHPAPIDEPPIIQPLSEFLAPKDLLNLMSVSKGMKFAVETLCPFRKVSIQTSKCGKVTPKLPLTQDLTILCNEEKHSAIVCKILASAKNVTTLTLNAHYGMNYKVIESLLPLPNLRVLTMKFDSYGYEINSGALLILCDLLPQMNLRKLRLQSVCPLPLVSLLFTTLAKTKIEALDIIVMEDEEELPHLTEPLPSLKNLSVYQKRRVRGPDTLRVFEWLEKMPNLEKLKYTQEEATGIENQTLPLTLFPKVKKFIFRIPAFARILYGQEFMNRIFGLFPNVEELNLDSAPKEVFRWIDYGKHFPKLKKFSAGSVPDLPTEIFQTLPDSLECLYIHGINITDYSQLTAQLPRWNNLWSLGLNGNPRMSSALDFVKGLTTHCPNLEELGLTLAGMEKKLATSIFTELGKLNNLENIYCYTNCHLSTRLSPVDIETLRKFVPTTVIYMAPQNREKKARARSEP